MNETNPLTPAETINRNNNNRRVDQFYVSFYKLPENVSNLLGRQTKSIDRPSIRFETSNLHRRHNQYTDMHQPRFSPITITMFDDENGLVNQYIYIQLFRQMNRGEDVFGRWPDLDRDYRFDVKMEMINSVGKVVEGYILRDCFFSSVDHDRLMTTDEESETEITLEITYDNIDFFVVDDYVELAKGIPMPSTSRKR